MDLVITLGAFVMFGDTCAAIRLGRRDLPRTARRLLTGWGFRRDGTCSDLLM